MIYSKRRLEANTRPFSQSLRIYNKLIIIEGCLCCCKTTQTHKIVRDWARGPNILTEELKQCTLSHSES